MQTECRKNGKDQQKKLQCWMSVVNMLFKSVLALMRPSPSQCPSMTYTNSFEGHHRLLKQLFNGQKVSRVEFINKMTSYWETLYLQFPV
jgi:hypothetical protein